MDSAWIQLVCGRRAETTTCWRTVQKEEEEEENLPSENSCSKKPRRSIEKKCEFMFSSNGFHDDDDVKIDGWSIETWPRFAFKIDFSSWPILNFLLFLPLWKKMPTLVESAARVRVLLVCMNSIKSYIVDVVPHHHHGQPWLWKVAVLRGNLLSAFLSVESDNIFLLFCACVLNRTEGKLESDRFQEMFTNRNRYRSWREGACYLNHGLVRFALQVRLEESRSNPVQFPFPRERRNLYGLFARESLGDPCDWIIRFLFPRVCLLKCLPLVSLTLPFKFTLPFKCSNFNILVQHFVVCFQVDFFRRCSVWFNISSSFDLSGARVLCSLPCLRVLQTARLILTSLFARVLRACCASSPTASQSNWLRVSSSLIFCPFLPFDNFFFFFFVFAQAPFHFLICTLAPETNQDGLTESLSGFVLPASRRKKKRNCRIRNHSLPQVSSVKRVYFSLCPGQSEWQSSWIVSHGASLLSSSIFLGRYLVGCEDDCGGKGRKLEQF